MELFTSVIFRILFWEGTVFLLLLSVLSHSKQITQNLGKVQEREKKKKKHLFSVHPVVFTLHLRQQLQSSCKHSTFALA